MKPYFAGIMISRSPTLPTPPPTSTFTPYSVANSSYSWWCNPISIRYGNYNYFSCVALSGYQMLHRIDNLGNLISVVVHSGYGTDEHNTPAILPMGNRILVTYCGHNTPTINRVIYDLDLNVVETDTVLDTGGAYSYSQLVQSNGKVFLFSRSNVTTWRMFISSNGGLTFSAPILFLKNPATYSSHLYMYSQKISANEILACICFHPLYAQNNQRIRKTVINTLSGEMIDSDGTLIDNVYSLSAQINVGNLAPIYVPDSGYTYRMLDTTFKNGKSYVLIDTYLVSEATTDAETGLYKLLEIDSSGAWTEIDITTHGIDTYATYHAGAYFVQNIDGNWNGDIYLGKEASGVWTVEKWNFNGTSLTKIETIDTLTSDTLSLTRPKPPYGSIDGGARLIYQKGNYYESYNHWDNELKLI